MARAHVAAMGGPVDLEPHDALVWAVKLTAGEVRFFDGRIAQLGTDQIAGQATVTTTRRGRDGGEAEGDGDAGIVVETRQLAPSLHVYVAARANALERLSRFAKMALDAGVDERRVQIAERQAAQIGAIFNAVHRALVAAGATRDVLHAFGQAVDSNLQLIEGTATEVPL